jgi:hypothetical protein
VLRHTWSHTYRTWGQATMAVLSGRANTPRCKLTPPTFALSTATLRKRMPVVATTPELTYLSRYAFNRVECLYKSGNWKFATAMASLLMAPLRKDCNGIITAHDVGCPLHNLCDVCHHQGSQQEHVSCLAAHFVECESYSCTCCIGCLHK